MVKNTIYATYTETYDINTTVGHMALLGIHTPTAPSLKRMFRGFFEQYKKFKIDGCDIVGVCASNQALTPGEVGLTSGLTDPRDVLNPILFRACTGEQMNLLLDKIYQGSNGNYGSLTLRDESASAELGAYYTMLSDDSYRKFHPQGGVRITDLKPYVFKVATTQPFKWSVAEHSGVYDSPHIGNSTIANNTVDASNNPAVGFGGSSGTSGANPSVFVTNGIEPMPWLETTYEADQTDDEAQSHYSTVIASNVPRVYCGILALPPAVLQPLYFRFSIRWRIAFREFRPAFEIGTVEVNGGGVGDDGTEEYGMQSNNLYYNLYNVMSSLKNEYGSFDANGVDSAELVNEKVQ